MALRTFAERWTLFVATLLSVALGVGLVESSALILDATGRLGADDRPIADSVDGFVQITLGLALFLSVFIISSTFTFTLTERRRDLALLRLTGASRSQLRLLLVGEGLVVGLLGSLGGLVLGLLLVRVQLASLARLGLPVDRLRIEPSTWAVVVSVAVGVGFSLAGVLSASRRAVRVRPLEALRDIGSAARVMTAGRWFWGLFFAAVTAVAVVGLQAVTDVAAALLLALGVIFSGTIALQQLSPLVVPLVGRLACPVARVWPEAQVAQASLVDARRRTATVAGPLIVLVGIVVGLFGILQTQAAAGVRQQQLSTSAQLVVQTRGVDPGRIAGVAGVAAAAPLTAIEGQVGLPDQAEGRDATIVVTEPAAYLRVMRPRLVSGDLAAFGNQSVLVGDDEEGPVPAGARAARVTAGGRSTDLAVAGRVGLTLADPYAVLVPRSRVPAELLDRTPTRTMVLVSPGAGVDQVRDNLLRAGFGDVTTVEEWAMADAAGTDAANRAVLAGLAGLGGFYALLSVVNAVALGTAVRAREFAVARLTGMTRAQVVASSVLETLAVSVIGILLGAVVSATCLYGVRRGMTTLLGEPLLVVPWAAFGLVAGLSIVATLAAAALATVVATRPRPITLAAAAE